MEHLAPAAREILRSAWETAPLKMAPSKGDS